MIYVDFVIFLFYANFESILVPEDNGKHNLDGSAHNGYELVCVDDECSKPFRSYLVEGANYNLKCWICDNVNDDGDVKTIDHCNINEKYIGSALRDSNIKVKLNYESYFTT